ncbi:MAG: fimbrial biogenesis outer membrane usher protein [Sphingomonas sp.]|uniref:fimbrial biogenesis outer membrane usher protein n=1 Tax=Sphingomonas sp. TaxID=28214 RepID=UPI001B079D22|nr:fimbrial biogenesis outer membrane usher protein [Sphingomonas sp.]MBO9624310.1 fimbrial biogenesis outer membrane usher protein [Sphingomonas sp.]
MIRAAAAGAIAFAGVAAPLGAQAQQQAAAGVEQRVVLDPPGAATEINPTGRPVVLTAPVMDGSTYLGDATVTLDPEGRAIFSAPRLIALLEPRLTPAALDRLRKALAADGVLSLADLQAAEVGARYNPQALEIQLEIASASRASRAVGIAERDARMTVGYAEPADFSAYLNVRGSLDFVEQGPDTGLAPPVMFLDGAARLGGVVLESEANWQPGGAGPDLQRRGTRLVYDDTDRLIRWSAGDLQPLARGFQSSPDIAGLSVSRSYSVLAPQQIIRPRGSQSFQLDRRSIVEVRVNDQFVRRLELDPGSYDLHDFPFAQGANDVRLTITDDAGRSETVRFNIFLDQTQLAAGLSEFGLYAGVLAPLGRTGPVYSNRPAVSGFYRRGLSDRLTLGANAQADDRGWMAGGEAVVASPIGSFGGFASASQVKGYGVGWAGIATFQRTIARSGGRADALSLSVEARSRDFAPAGTLVPRNPYSVVAGASYNSAISDAVYAGLDLRYSRGRDGEPDVSSVRGTMGWRIAPNLSFTGDASYERDARGRRLGLFLSLTYRLDRYSTLRADYDRRYDRARLSYQTYRGSGVGAYNFSADVERSDIGAAASLNGTYYANRAELGFSHFSTFDSSFGTDSVASGQRSSFRFGTSLAMADGAFSVGRPIQDGFALVRAHPSLHGADVEVDPGGGAFVANTGTLGSAIQPSLSSYSERTILLDSPEAPLGANLGEGSFRLFPPYRGGYKLTVGSDYMVSLVGRLLTAAGEPLALVAGTATEEAHPEREPIPLFTNSAGRFGVTGLAPGRWRIVMTDADTTGFAVVVPKGAEGSISVGDLKPAGP